MAILDDLIKLVDEYQARFRHPEMQPLTFVPEFDLNVTDPICPVDAAKKGVYAIFCGEKIIYIGKSSAQKKAIWHRIVDHIYIVLKRVSGATKRLISLLGLYQMKLFLKRVL
ncbi:hypothetical protein BA893_06905 [Vibrio natriegens]|uniref:hypothetical protein n=1 Tax=Vibrio natriegens TaxID=691 RepID=UPI0008042720|nr:hypothetical protein [Vibrio natriegens]ANQ21409.1 hypothetical protein BA893_06905 [Vibrio natriegens]